MGAIWRCLFLPGTLSRCPTLPVCFFVHPMPHHFRVPHVPSVKKKVDWLALVSFMQAAENNDDGANTNNISDNPTSGRKQSTVRGRERPGLRSTFSRDSSRPEKQHWATSGLGRGRRGLFGGKGDTNTG